MYKTHLPKGNIDRLYVNRKGGGRSLLQIRATCKAEIINIVEHLNTKFVEDQLINIIKSHESIERSTSSTIKPAAKVAEELNQ
jgi:hypothetical protein